MKRAKATRSSSIDRRADRRRRSSDARPELLGPREIGISSEVSSLQLDGLAAREHVIGKSPRRNLRADTEGIDLGGLARRLQMTRGFARGRTFTCGGGTSSRNCAFVIGSAASG